MKHTLARVALVLVLTSAVAPAAAHAGWVKTCKRSHATRVEYGPGWKKTWYRIDCTYHRAKPKPKVRYDEACKARVDDQYARCTAPVEEGRRHCFDTYQGPEYALENHPCTVWWDGAQRGCDWQRQGNIKTCERK